MTSFQAPPEIADSAKETLRSDPYLRQLRKLDDPAKIDAVWDGLTTAQRNDLLKALTKAVWYLMQTR
jgi:hypothetical protein